MRSNQIFKNKNIGKYDYENREFKDFVYIKEKDEKEIKSVRQRDTELIKKKKVTFLNTKAKIFVKFAIFPSKIWIYWSSSYYFKKPAKYQKKI